MIAIDTNVIVRVVTADDPGQLAVALEVLRSGELWVCESGLDFADALHLASSSEAQRFVTFDGPLAKRAKKIQREVGPPVDLLRMASS